MSEPTNQTPVQEAISLITIAAILVAVVCYVATVGNIPVVSVVLFWIATKVYAFLPILNSLRSPQIPMLVSAAAIGGTVWVLGLACAAPLATWLSAGQIAGIERQTARLKKNRSKIAQRRKDKDDFDVE